MNSSNNSQEQLKEMLEGGEYRDLHFSSAPLKQRIVNSSNNLQDGQVKCPKCGATEISLNAKTGQLRCDFCRAEFEPVKSVDFVEDIATLEEEVIGSGAADIPADAETIVTMKCTSCGAEVVIDTASSEQARCHWCRSTLSINQQVPNGAVPDMVLPFSTARAQAKELIDQFVGKRMFYAHPKFKAEYTANNVMGVYLPYMIVDANAVAYLSGEGEHTDRTYSVTVKGSNGKTHSEKRYDVSTYHVERVFPIQIKALTVESSADKMERNTNDRTNNIINAIMPFDTENCQKWNANYLKGYSSEKRDVNLEALRPRVYAQCEDIARFAALESIEYYDRGVRWDDERLDMKGRQWRTAYLPVWLYSYIESKKDGEEMVHYVAVNGRTNETMGSVPINKPKLTIYSVLVEILCYFLKILMDLTFIGDITLGGGDDGGGFRVTWALMCGGIGYYYYIYNKYRNPDARHAHEAETQKTVGDFMRIDSFVRKQTRVKHSSMRNANEHSIHG